MILHTINKSPLRHRSLQSCLQFCAGQDGVLLLEDGVYAAMRGVDCGLDSRPGPVYAIAADVDARGLAGRLRDDVVVVDYAGFVDLCTRYEVVKNWP
jgi:tRNA 2-thiouridine synthesizing protein B